MPRFDSTSWLPRLGDALTSWLRRIGSRLEHFANLTSDWVGTSWAFILAFLLTVGWVVSGPIFHFSDTWQLVMNTISSIVTFLMVFLLQRAQNKDSIAAQTKLNELLAAVRGASNRLINVEETSEDEVRALHDRYAKLAERAVNSGHVCASSSIEEVEVVAARAPPSEQSAERGQP